MARKVITVALNGVTGRMGYRQHLVRSLLAIREQGGVRLEDGSCLYPEPILVGRSAERLRAIAERHGLDRWTTSVDEVLSDPSVDVYFDTQVTSAREVALLKAIEAGKHVYCEKPLTHDVYEARVIREAAAKAKVATQMGTQIHAGDNYRRVVELIEAGAIGPVTEAHDGEPRPLGGDERHVDGDAVGQQDRHSRATRQAERHQDPG